MSSMPGVAPSCLTRSDFSTQPSPETPRARIKRFSSGTRIILSSPPRKRVNLPRIRSLRPSSYSWLSVASSKRHTGQLFAVRSHSRMQFVQKRCPQSIRVARAPALYSSRQTAHFEFEASSWSSFVTTTRGRASRTLSFAGGTVGPCCSSMLLSTTRRITCSIVTRIACCMSPAASSSSPAPKPSARTPRGKGTAFRPLGLSAAPSVPMPGCEMTTRRGRPPGKRIPPRPASSSRPPSPSKPGNSSPASADTRCARSSGEPLNIPGAPMRARGRPPRGPGLGRPPPGPPGAPEAPPPGLPSAPSSSSSPAARLPRAPPATPGPAPVPPAGAASNR
mmetsp:Transcript_91724/g.259635  ORF Transcript_91724/g.259635 Transcript_91724/m.259635 type:complete len:335 (-) Transcript_91724:86-1090(-)